MKNKGFTLIELLVVIAIIGILSGVVLTSLGTARNKGSDAAVKGDLDGIRSAAEIYYDNNSQAYGAAFTTADCPTSGTSMFYADAGIRQAISAAKTAGGNSAKCGSTGTAWAVAALLKSTASYWCVDSTGQAIVSTSSSTPVSSVAVCQ